MISNSDLAAMARNAKGLNGNGTVSNEFLDMVADRLGHMGSNTALDLANDPGLIVDADSSASMH